MTFCGFLGRLLAAFLLSCLLVVLTGGGLVWVLLFFFTPVGSGLALLLFAPIEILAYKLRVRWLGFLLMPPTGAAAPWVVSFFRNNPNYTDGLSQLCLLGAGIGVLWVAASLAVIFLPPLPSWTRD